MSIDVPTAGSPVLDTWGEAVADAINTSLLAAGFVPFAYPLGLHHGTASIGASAKAAVSGGLAGGALVPFMLIGPMAIQSVTIRNGDTASARSCEFAIYRDEGNGTLARVAGTDGTLSFTPVAVSDRTGDVSTPGTIIPPGIAWLGVRNTSSSQTFGMRYATVGTEAVGNMVWSDDTAAFPALGATFDTSAGAGISGTTYLCRLNGRVFGLSAAF